MIRPTTGNLKAKPPTDTTGLRYLVLHTTGHSMLGRGDDRRSILLHDVGLYRHPTKADVNILIIILNQGKMNTAGRLEYGGVVRHRDVHLCPVMAVAMWLFWRWQVLSVPTPCFTPTRDTQGRVTHLPWFDEYLVPGHHKTTQLMNPKTGLSYETMRSEADKAMSSIEHPVQSRKKTHIERSSGVTLAELSGVDYRDLEKLGHWANDVMSKTYLTGLPMKAVFKIAGWSETGDMAELHRAKYQFPDSLRRELFPFLEEARSVAQQNGLEAGFCSPFLDLLEWLRCQLAFVI